MKICANPSCPDRTSLGIPGEYVDSIETCPKCGASLVAAETESESQSAAPSDGLALAGAVIGSARLPLAKSLLEDAGIEFYTRNELTQDLLGWGQFGTGFNPIVGPFEIWVPESSLEEAKSLLASLESPEASEESNLADEDDV